MVAAGVVLASVILVGARGRLPRGRAVVFGNSSHLSFCLRSEDFVKFTLPWCTTPIEAESSLGPDSHHPIISLSGIPSAVMVLRILHPILASTLCAANPLARIAEPTITL